MKTKQKPEAPTVALNRLLGAIQSAVALSEVVAAGYVKPSEEDLHRLAMLDEIVRLRAEVSALEAWRISAFDAHLNLDLDIEAETPNG